MFEHLDDPVPLPPSTSEQRRATRRRGASLRRRRRTAVAAVGVAVAAVVGALAGSPAVRDAGVVPPVAASPGPSAAATATAGPGRGSIAVGSTNPQLTVTFTMPAGWENVDGWLFRSDNYGRPNPGTGMPYGFVFLDVANVYADGCRWQLVDPPPGPTVDDLVAAYEEVPGAGGPVRDITVDGFPGKRVDHAVPPYEAEDCENQRFGLFKEADLGPADTPNILAQAPRQQNQVRILDVGGNRLVILTGHPPGISAGDRAELDAILDSVEIR